MKILYTILRVLMGLVFIITSVTYLFKIIPTPELSGDIKAFNDGVEASGYLMPMAKIIELVCGIAFVTGRFVPLATALIIPIVVNIFCVHLFMAPEGLPVAIALVLVSIFLVYYHRDRYTPLVHL